MNKVICTTTIFEPSPALIKFAAMKDWKLVIAGDKKTPHYEETNVIGTRFYLTPEAQEKYDPKLSDLIGWNCIQRRNFAFLFACKELKADVIATVDDDNIPMDGWGEDMAVGQFARCIHYDTNAEAFDPVCVAINRPLWHRGFPLELLKKRADYKASYGSLKCDVQANLWNGEPDVDAICRLVHDTMDCVFQTDIGQTDPVLFTSSKPSPFNSQNTFLSREVMPHYFMFPGIGRYDDIMASYHVQAQGFRVMYGGPTVVQKRNEHSLIADLMAEMWGIEKCLSVVKEVPTNKNAVLDRLPERSLAAFRQYQTHFE